MSGVGVYPFRHLEDAPVVSAHPFPQPSPQEFDCGCVTATWVTDRDAMTPGENPFEMRLAEDCGRSGCCRRQHETEVPS